MKKNINKDVIALALMLFSIIFLLIDYFLFNHTRAMIITIIIGGIAFLVSLSFAIYNYFKKNEKWINYLCGFESTINNLRAL